MTRCNCLLEVAEDATRMASQTSVHEPWISQYVCNGGSQLLLAELILNGIPGKPCFVDR
jgi:hypothetical protein